MNLKKFANALADFCLDNPGRALGTVGAVEFGAWYARSRAKDLGASSTQSVADPAEKAVGMFKSVSTGAQAAQ
jgi:hypothetical protein